MVQEYIWHAANQRRQKSKDVYSSYVYTPRGMVACSALVTSQRLGLADVELRKRIVRFMEVQLHTWVRCVSQEHDAPSDFLAEFSVHVLPYGSFVIGTSTIGSDIDALCIVPRNISDACFFGGFRAHLLATGQVQSAKHVDAKVPLLKLCMKEGGVEVDLSLRVSNEFLPTVGGELHQLPGVLVGNYINAATAQHNAAFVDALLFLKLWAKRREVASFALGYLNNISLAVMLLKVYGPLQSLAALTADLLVETFFAFYAELDFGASAPSAIAAEANTCGFNPCKHWLSVVLPVPPFGCTSYNVGKHQLQTLRREFARADACLSEGAGGLASVLEELQIEEFAAAHSIFFVVQGMADQETMEYRLREFVASILHSRSSRSYKIKEADRARMSPPPARLRAASAYVVGFVPLCVEHIDFTDVVMKLKNQCDFMLEVNPTRMGWQHWLAMR